MKSPSVIEFRVGPPGLCFFPIINGKPLLSRIRQFNADISSNEQPVFGYVEFAFERILLKKPPDLPDNRNSIFACPCGDLGCGAISAVIRRDGMLVHWESLGVSNDLGIDDGSPWLFDRPSSFSFDWQQYCDAVRQRK